MKKIITLLVLLSSITMLAGCASIVSKSQYPVTIHSNPSGATVAVKNKSGIIVHKATTPATLSLKANSGFFSPASYSFEFEKNGYYNGSTSLSAGMDPWYVGNIIFGGLIGIVIVDPATGSMWKLDDAVYGNLSPDPSANNVTAAGNTSLVTASTASKLKTLKDLKDSGILTAEEYKAKRQALMKDL